VNSEELELSLRSEFDAHLKKIFADVQQQVTEFQDKIDVELGKHRTQMLDALNEFSSRMSADTALDNAFSETVIEHLRIARDDGAKIAAKAMADAEALDGSPSSVSFNFARDAVNDISSQTSQSAILHTLVRHCEQFAPRGVFFIIRNEHFIGWQALGDESHADEASVRELNFEASSDTVVSDAIHTLSTAERAGGSGSDESIFLTKLGFSSPSKMRAIPLIARGRGVAALYVDGGAADRPVNIEALEMLVRVAGLTVELLASNQAARPQADSASAQAVPAVHTEAHADENNSLHTVSEPETVTEPEIEAAEATEFEGAGEPRLEQTEDLTPVSHVDFEAPTDEISGYEVEGSDQPEAQETIEAEHVAVVEEYQFEAEAETRDEVETRPTRGFDFSTDSQYETPVQHFRDADVVEPAVMNGSGPSPEPAVEQEPAQQRQPGTRRLDLPIEVSEEERGTHTKARRFARLLVSEIKLYNEDKVRQGRAAGDLYERLKEAIDRSREMYDRRVEPPVSSRFDYFHYELVHDLAQGDPNRLGSSYPGSAI
jgi:hypothetical protein